jgi:NDP-sugar pyrophosphorylase family protein
MAAGEGRRLLPITERWPKPILPVDGRAVIAALVRQLQAEGMGPITVVTGYLAERVEEFLEGLDVRFVRQPQPDGSADAVRRALDGGAGLPAIVTAADTVFRPGDLARVAGAERSAGAIAYRPDPRKARIAVDDGAVRRSSCRPRFSVRSTRVSELRGSRSGQRGTSPTQPTSSARTFPILGAR